MTDHDERFRCMGCAMRLVVGPPATPDGPLAGEAAARAKRSLHHIDARLSRFRPDSELSALNADPHPVVPASALLRGAVSAALAVARSTGGLVDPTLLRPLRDAGYAESLDGAAPPPLREALAVAPPRRPAAPHRERAWESVRVDHRAGTIVRPPGLELDLGGTAKGLAADLVADGLRDQERYVVDVAGDLRVGGRAAAEDPFDVHVVGPFDAEFLYVLPIGSGAVATSGIGARLRRRSDGSFAHHLLDPATGRPAWTGVAMATALAPTALEAEARAKRALLSGPTGARAALADHGGLIVLDDGSLRLAGGLEPRHVVRLRLPATEAAA
jgi:thiamine biosynthesis lipoprotein